MWCNENVRRRRAKKVILGIRVSFTTTCSQRSNRIRMSEAKRSIRKAGIIARLSPSSSSSFDATRHCSGCEKGPRKRILGVENTQKEKRKKRNNIKRIRKPFFEGYITQSLRIVHTSGVSWGEEDSTDARWLSWLELASLLDDRQG